jgi:hypothetical protein
MNDSEISFTEFEFEVACNANLSVLAFIQDDREAEDEISKDGNVLEKVDELTRLKKFRERVKANSFTHHWNGSSNFAEIVSRGFKRLLDMPDAIHLSGWVRSDQEIDTKAVRTALKNSFVLDTVRNLNRFKRLDKRCSQDVPQKQAAARGFREFFLTEIKKQNYDLFFESGSTPAYVARELGKSEAFRNEVGWGGDESAIALYTNNILAFLQLWLNDNLPIAMLPRSSPREPYGGSYGLLTKHLDYKKGPDFTGKPLPEHEKEVIDLFCTSADSLPTNRQILIVGAISGIQLSEEYRIKESEEGAEKGQGASLLEIGSPCRQLYQQSL